MPRAEWLEEQGREAEQQRYGCSWSPFEGVLEKSTGYIFSITPHTVGIIVSNIGS